jgi:hypothetical protein
MVDELTCHQRPAFLLGAAPPLRSAAQPQTRSCWEVGADVAIRPAKGKDRRASLARMAGWLVAGEIAPRPRQHFVNPDDISVPPATIRTNF